MSNELKKPFRHNERGQLADAFKQSFQIPHVDVWNAVEAKLEGRRRKRVVVWWTGIAAGLCFLLGLNLFIQMERSVQDYQLQQVQSAGYFNMDYDNEFAFYRVVPGNNITPQKNTVLASVLPYQKITYVNPNITEGNNATESNLKIAFYPEKANELNKVFISSTSNNKNKQKNISLNLKREEGRNWFIGSQAGLNVFSQSNNAVNTLKSANALSSPSSSSSSFSGNSSSAVSSAGRPDYSYSQNPGVNIHLGRKIQQKTRVNMGFGFQQFSAEREMMISSDSRLLEKKTMELYATEIGIERDLLKIGDFHLFGEFNLRHLSGRSIRSESTTLTGSEEDISLSSSLSKTKINTSGLFAGINKQINRFTLFVKGGINYKLSENTTIDGPNFPIADENHKAYSSVFLGVRASI